MAAALAGNLLVDLAQEPVGFDPQGRPVRLADLWPDHAEVAAVVRQATRDSAPDTDTDAWDALPASAAPRFPWDPDSTFVCAPPFIRKVRRADPGDLIDARPLLWLGDDVTTDHISPIGRIPPGSPAGNGCACAMCRRPGWAVTGTACSACAP